MNKFATWTELIHIILNSKFKIKSNCDFFLSLLSTRMESARKKEQKAMLIHAVESRDRLWGQ